MTNSVVAGDERPTLVEIIEQEIAAREQAREQLLEKIAGELELLEHMLDGARRLEGLEDLGADPDEDEPEPEPVPDRSSSLQSDASDFPPSSEAPKSEPVAAVGRDGLGPGVSRTLEALRKLGACRLSELVAEVGLAQPTVSDHLALLRTRGLAEHNGRGGRASRWSPVGGGITGSPATPIERAAAASKTPSGLDGSVEGRVRLALRYAKAPLKTGAIASKAHATNSRDRQLVDEALARMEREGEAVVVDDRWELTATGRGRLAA